MLEDRSEPDRFGVFGSAFNPPQKAHVALVQAAREQLGLDRVIVVPTGEAYHKRSDSDPGPEVRARLAEAAFSGLEWAQVSRSEVEREGPSYTYVTLESIARDNPDSEIHLLMGADTARGFGSWKRPERIVELARIAVVPRPGIENEEVSGIFDSIGGTDRLDFLEMPATGVSSSEIRSRIAAGGYWADMVPAAVAEIINNEGVYGSEL